MKTRRGSSLEMNENISNGQGNSAEPQQQPQETSVKPEPNNQQQQPSQQQSVPPPSTGVKSETGSSTPVPAPAVSNQHDVNAGAPTRQWLNNEVTPALVEAMRRIASEKPQDPVRALANHLLDYANSHPPKSS